MNDAPSLLSRTRDRIRTINRRRIERRRLAKPAMQTPFGFKFNGLGKMQSGNWEVEERELIQRIFPRVDLFLNVGAHYGFYCCLAQEAGLTTIAMEPVAANCRMIARNIRANNWGENFTLLPVAAGNVSGFAEIQGGGSGGTIVKAFSQAPASQIQTVPVARISDLVHPDGRKSLVLMDVEGFEYAALQGAMSLITSEPKPIWVIEIFTGGGPTDSYSVNPHFAETFALMRDAGYNAWQLDDGTRPFGVDDVAKMQAAGTSAPRGGNFLFVDAGAGTDWLRD